MLSSLPWKVIGKRAVDVVLSTIALPPMVAIIATAAVGIRFESPGSPIFCQERVGLHGRLFKVYKLRTMVANAENIGAGLYAEKDDPRFTKVGLILRRTSLDELPQLINVLKGEMSLVGPRPMVPQVVQEYSTEYSKILTVKPGITGLSQVSGRNDLSRKERLKYDMMYADAATLMLDAKILLKTIMVVFTGDGQRNDQSYEDVEHSKGKNG